MSNTEIITTVEELQQLRRLQDDLEAEIAALQDRIKAHMDASGLDQMNAGAWKVSYKAVTSTRLDSAALKKAMPELAERFTRTTTTRRFTVV